jgi:hypothetical protein
MAHCSLFQNSSLVHNGSFAQNGLLVYNGSLVQNGLMFYLLEKAHCSIMAQ